MAASASAAVRCFCIGAAVSADAAATLLHKLQLGSLHSAVSACDCGPPYRDAVLSTSHWVGAPAAKAMTESVRQLWAISQDQTASSRSGALDCCKPRTQIIMTHQPTPRCASSIA